MSRTSTFFVLTLAATLAVTPAAVAGWSAKGSYEPDTAADVAGKYMFTSADVDPSQAVRKVYFNGFEGDCNSLCSSLNPNVGDPAIRTGLTSTQNLHLALLGVWKDCNGDGAIGLADQGLWEYRNELLVGPYGTGICPKQTVPSPIPSGWMPVHNDGAWVHEFLPIQWRAAGPTDFNVYNINDNGARVWWDNGLPTDDLGANGGGDCWLNPQPHGTWHNAGGVLRFVDCNDGWRVTDAFDTIADAAANPGGVSFSDAPRDQQTSSSTLNVKPWGEESDASDAQVWDCSQPRVTSQAVGSGWVNVSAPNANPAPRTDGSLAGTTNATASGIDRCDRRSNVNGGGQGGHYATLPYEGGCTAGYPCEGDVIQAGHAKTFTTVMTPKEGARPTGALSLVDKNAPPDGGVHYQPSSSSASAGRYDFWDDFTDEIGGVTALGANHITYYAVVSSTAITNYGLSLRTTSVGKYGAEACGTHQSGTYAGWNCDANAWWKDSDGRDVGPTTTYFSNTPVSIGPKVGAEFNLRDIDCADASVKPARDAQLSQGQIYNAALGGILNGLAPGQFGATVGTCATSS